MDWHRRTGPEARREESEDGSSSAMTKIRSMTGGPPRRASSARNRAKSQGLALLGLALVGLIQSGCRSDGCSTCGGFASRLTNEVQALGARVFNHHKGCGGGLGCGCGGEEGTVIDPGVTVVPGGISMPAPGTIVPAPAIESPPTQLEPIESSQPANPTSGKGSGTNSSNPASTRSTPGGNNRSAYTTMAPKAGASQRRGSDVARALHSSPEGSNRSGDSSASNDLLDNIPPVDLPSEVTRKAASPAAGTAPAPTMPPARNSSPVATDNAAPTPAEKVSAAEGVPTSLPTSIAVASHQAPGIRRFASVAPTVGGGSAPSIEGLDWLREKGYRTFIDLRRGSEVEPNFADSVNDRGMVYISLSVVANHLDPSRLARFDDLISQSDNRPLFFCDSDGTRAGLVWYIHVRTVDHEDSQAAAGKAEEIGLTVAEAKLAEDYLAAHKPRAKAAVALAATSTPPSPPEPKDESKPADAPPPAAQPSIPASPEPAAGPAPVPSTPEEPTPSMLPGEHRPQASTRPSVAPTFYRDPTAWRPLAALVLSGIGVPLAYWSRSVLSGVRSVRHRASLPAAAPRSLDAPAGSDA